MFHFIGRMIAKAIFDNQLVGVHFTRAFFNLILGREIQFLDFESFEPEYYKNLVHVLQIEDEEELKDLDLNFTTEIESFGKRNVVELIKGGSKINVTLSNKEEYVKLVARHKMITPIQSQVQSFLEGFYEIVPLAYISHFNPSELELVMCGLPKIDFDDLKENTNYSGGK